jgi:hypothetical protein
MLLLIPAFSDVNAVSIFLATKRANIVWLGVIRPYPADDHKFFCPLKSAAAFLMGDVTLGKEMLRACRYQNAILTAVNDVYIWVVLLLHITMNAIHL